MANRPQRIGRNRHRAGDLIARVLRLKGVGETRAGLWRKLKPHLERHWLEPSRDRIIWSTGLLQDVYLRAARDQGVCSRSIISSDQLRDVPVRAHCCLCGDGLAAEESAKIWSAVLHGIGEAIVCPTCIGLGKARAHNRRGSTKRLFQRAGLLSLECSIKSLAGGAKDHLVKEDHPMKNTADLRAALIEDFEALRRGELSRPEARVRAYVAKQVIETLKVECVASAANVDHYAPVTINANSVAIAAE